MSHRTAATFALASALAVAATAFTQTKPVCPTVDSCGAPHCPPGDPSGCGIYGNPNRVNLYTASLRTRLVR